MGLFNFGSKKRRGEAEAVAPEEAVAPADTAATPDAACDKGEDAPAGSFERTEPGVTPSSSNTAAPCPDTQTSTESRATAASSPLASPPRPAGLIARLRAKLNR